jgi:hypothetical protein
MSSPVALMCGAAVIMAGLAFFTTGGDDQRPVATPVAASPSPTHKAKPVRTAHETTATPKKKAPRPVRRDGVYVSVFNNSNVTGLAARTAERIGAVGWQVVGSDNWYGTIPATTIYYPARLKRAATLLSKDIGVPRLMPAVDPMSMDRLTVIVTADYA